MATIITKTIGQDGWQDFSAIQQATDAITTSDVANTADLVTADVAVVFEIYAGIYDESVQINEGLTCDATRNVTYKPAVGSEHGGSVSKGVRISPSVGTGFANLRDDFVTLDGLVIDCDSNGIATIATDGLSVRNCIIDVGGQGIQATYGNTGTASAPLTVENCVITSAARAIYFAALYGAAGPIHYAVRNCTLQRTTGIDAILTHNAGDTNYGQFTNNIILNGGFNQSGSNSLTGSDNIGPAGSFSWPSALQAESQTWTFETDTTQPSTGSQVIYTSATGELVNVSGNDAIGVGTATGAPTTDINGEDRVRGFTSLFADPGAFTTKHVEIIKTISVTGPSDYNTFQEADAAYGTLGSEPGELSKRNESIVFEVAAGEYFTEDPSWGLQLYDPTTVGDRKCSVVFRAAKGSEHNGDSSSGVILRNDPAQSPSKVIEINATNLFFRIEGINVRADSNVSYATISTNGSLNAIISNCILYIESIGGRTIAYTKSAGNADNWSEVNNCISTGGRGILVQQAGTGRILYTKLHNNTITNSGNNSEGAILITNVTSTATNVLEVDLVNNLCLSPFAYQKSGAGTHEVITGSNNVGGSTEPFPTPLQAGSQAWTFSTSATAPSTGNQVIYSASNLSMPNVSGNDAVGVGTGTAIPTTDVNGVSRIRGASSEYADPGAFSVDKITYTKTIGKDGWQEFTDFIDAEAESDTIPYDTNLAERNLDILFDAYAGTYQEDATLEFANTLTTGPGNGITVKASSDSQHLGVSGEGVYLVRPSNSSNLNILMNTDYLTLDGLSVYNQQTNGRLITINSLRNGATIRNCLLHADFSNGVCIQSSRKSAGNESPNIIENNVIRWHGNYGIYLAQVQGSETSPGRAAVRNNTFQPSMTGGVSIGIADTGSYFDLSADNNLILSGLSMYWVGDVRITGKGNFDVQTAVQGQYKPLPNNLRGSEAPITVSLDPAANSTGSQVIIDGTKLSMVNVSGNDIIGVGDTTNAPTTDINGVDRIRGASNEYADPGAFTTNLVTFNKKIGPTREYTTFGAAEDAEVGISTDGNLAQRNEAIVFEADAGIYSESVVFENTLTTDTERTVTYKAGENSEHGGDVTKGVRFTTGFNGLEIRQRNMVLDGVVIDLTSGNPLQAKTQCHVKNTIVSSPNRPTLVRVETIYETETSSAPVFENMLCIGIQRSFQAFNTSNSITFTPKFINCTMVGTPQGVRIDGITYPIERIDIINCFATNTNNGTIYNNSVGDSTLVSGTGNIGRGGGQHANSDFYAEGKSWYWTTDVTATSTGTQAIYTSATGALVNVSGNDAVGVGTGTQAPTTDINGVSRIRGASNEYADPGAFTTDLITATKVIDINQGAGYDYSGFIEAEDDVEEVAHELLGGTRENLAQRNGSIVFEARAGTYLGYWVVNTPLILDPIRNITYKAAAGSEHGGSSSAGVIIDANGASRASQVEDDFIRLEGLVFVGGTTYTLWLQANGIVAHNCIAAPTNRGFLAYAGTSTYPIVLENCVSRGGSSYAFLIFSDNTRTTNARLTNCVGESTGNDAYRTQLNPNGGGGCTAEYINCVSLGTYSHQAIGDAIVTGSNNVGGALNRWPESTRAEGQFWTFTTDTTQPSTGNQVIYDASTGALVNVSGNDAVGVGTGSAITVPANDILGNSRIRGASNEYSDPGAFTTDLVEVVETVGPNGTYTTFNAAHQAIPAILNAERPGKVNVSKSNRRLIFDVESGSYSDGQIIMNPAPWATTTDRGVLFRGKSSSETVCTFSNSGSTYGFLLANPGLAFKNMTLQRSDPGAVISFGTASVGCKIENCNLITAQGFVGRIFGGTSTHPNVLKNCNIKTSTSSAFTIVPSIRDIYTEITNCTSRSSTRMIQQSSGSFNINLEVNNNLIIGTGQYQLDGNYTGTQTITGGGNVGGSSDPLPVSVQALSQTWTFDTDTTAASTGNQVIYTSATGALVNVSGNDAIGVGDTTKAPTTDINGVDRIRFGLGTQYADPGAFTSDIRTISKTIDSTGDGDYTTLFASEAALALSIPNPLSTNLVLRNEEIVFNTIPGQTITETSHVSVTGCPPAGPKNRIIWRCPDPTNRTLVDSTSTIGVFILKVPYITIENLNFRTEKYAVSFSADSGSDVVDCLVKNCVIDAYGTLAGLKASKATAYNVGTREEPNVVENVVTKAPAAISTYWPTDPAHAGTGASILIRNCTHMDSTNPAVSQNNAWNWESAGVRGHDYSIMELNNCLNLASGGLDCPVVELLGSGNVGNGITGSNSFSSRGVGINLNPTSNTSPGAGDWSIFTSATGELVNVSANDAIGVGTGTKAPITDINGVSRIRGASNEYADPGAFSVENITYNRTIGPGRDYDDFSEAEADVNAIPYDANFAKHNLAIVFEADAGYTNENVYPSFGAATILDSTRTVTFKNAPEAQHAGVAEQGPGVRTFSTQQDHVVIDGIVIGNQPNSAGTSTAIVPGTIGVRYKNCLFLPTLFNKVLDAGAAGSADYPTVIENCIFRGDSSVGSQRMINLEAYGSDAHAEAVNNTAILEGRMFVYFGGPNNKSLKAINNLFTGTGFVNIDSTCTIFGSSNLGAASVPSLLQAESQTWTFTTDTTASSTGSQVIYTSATGELVNVSGNDAVGIGTAVAVPTTDINGVSRLRGASNEYADPGAFTTDLLTFNKKIGPFREYTTFGDAEADVVAISTDGNLAQRNEAIVFEADAGTYAENVTFDSTLTSDATRNVTYKAGAGSEHGGVQGAGVVLVGEANALDAFTTFRDIEFSKTTVGNVVRPKADQGLVFDGVLFSPATVAGTAINTLVPAITRQATPHIFRNCVVFGGIDLYSDCLFEFTNCTVHNRVLVANAADVTFTNCLALGSEAYRTSSHTGTTSGSGNVGAANKPFPTAIQAEGQTWTFTTDTTASSTGNQVVYEAATGAMIAVSGNDAIGIGTTINVPTTDIKGTSRLRGVGTQYADPGAFTSNVNTITKTIGIGGAANGFDFDGFLEAEASVDTTAVTYSNNLPKKNIAIVFEADAGTYSENFTISNSLTCDPTRNVTYQSAAGGQAVIGNTYPFGLILITDGAFTTLRRLAFGGTATGASGKNVEINPASGATCEGCLLDSLTLERQGGNAVLIKLDTGATSGGAGSASHPTVIQNCVEMGLGAGVGITGTASDDIHVNVVNCTFAGTGLIALGINTSNDVTIKSVNNINLGHSWSWRDGQTTGGVTATGSNNFGGTNQPFPVALQAEGQTWTFTTDTAQPSTGDQVIYTSATGALVNVSGNDAIGVGTSVSVPANDILGKSRLRGLSNEYADPGAFTTDIETTTLTANPGTLSSLILNLTPYITTTNMAKRNESITIELEKADYPQLTFNNTQDIIGDSVRNITIKPQEGAHHKGIRGAGIRFIVANTGYDTFDVQDVSGFKLEGVELYTPADDIGRYLMVTRRSEGITYKDVIFNTVECDGKLTTQSWYSNGRQQPISFENGLFITNQGCFLVGTVVDNELHGKYEFTNCTLSGLASSRSAWQFDAVHAGTFELKLTNNLILSDVRNLAVRRIGNDNGFFGDAFVYGSNNTGPDTPNYQLNDAVRASLYPIEPTTDYTPVPSSPAAVYRAATLQPLDVPENDVLQIGLGTSASNIPLEGIGGQARATSSCNPGCWESNYELVDLEINTLNNTEGFRNRLYGPSTDIANAILPDDAVPIFIVIGDSTSQGFSVTEPLTDAELYKGNTAYWPSTAYDGSDVGYFWDKFMTSEDNGVTWTKSYPDYVTTDSSGEAFLPLHPRLGGISYGSFTYSVDPDPTQLAAVGNCSPLWDFALDIRGIFRRASGETVPPRFVHLGLPQSRLGSNGPDVGGFTEFNFSPNGFLYNTLLEAYIKPAVDSVLNEGKNPILVGVLILTGGSEANIAYNPNADGDKVSASGAQSYINFLNGITNSCNLNGRFPYMAYEVWDTQVEPTNFPKAYTELMRNSLLSLKNVHINRHVVLQDLLRDKIGGVANLGVHFLQREYVKYGRRFGQEYRSLLSMSRYPIYGRTLSDIFD